MEETSDNILRQLGINEKVNWESLKDYKSIPNISVIAKGEPIFMRLKAEEEIDYIKEIHIILDKLEGNQNYINWIKQLLNKYPDIKCFYKEKPITIEQYESMFLNKQEIMENCGCTHSQQPMNFRSALASLTKYILDQGLNITPLPKVKIINNDEVNAKNILGKTAYYDPNNC